MLQVRSSSSSPTMYDAAVVGLQEQQIIPQSASRPLAHVVELENAVVPGCWAKATQMKNQNQMLQLGLAG